jgi:exo-beta-1,3-glucanase (GH17 family)
LEAIIQTKVNMTVWLGNFVEDGDNTAYDRQRTAIQGALQTYGTTHIAGITVGNEVGFHDFSSLLLIHI